MSVTIKLTTPITAHGNELTELVLQKPTTADCRKIGVLPYSITAKQLPEPNLAACANYISTSAGIPPSSVDQLDVVDFNAAAWGVVGFFLSADSAASSS